MSGCVKNIQSYPQYQSAPAAEKKLPEFISKNQRTINQQNAAAPAN